MADLTLEGLLKTPTQVRTEQMALLEELGRKKAEALSTPTTSNIANILMGMGKTGVEGAPMMADLTTRGITSALGYLSGDQGVRELGLSPEEREAGAITRLTKKYGTSVEGLRKTADALREKGYSAVASKFSAKADEKEIKEETLKIEKEKLKLDKRKFKLEEDKSFAEVALGVSSGTLSSASPSSVAKALQHIRKNPGDIDGALALIKDKETGNTIVNIDQKGESEFAKFLGKENATAYTDSRKNVKSSNVSLKNLSVMKDLLIDPDKGVYTGALADLELQFNRLLGLGGMGDEEMVSNTQKYIKLAARETATLLGTGVLGSGTGLSDKDVEFANGITNGDITLTKKSLLELIEISEKANVANIDNHNKLVNQLNSQYNSSLPQESYFSDNTTYSARVNVLKQFVGGDPKKLEEAKRRWKARYPNKPFPLNP